MCIYRRSELSVSPLSLLPSSGGGGGGLSGWFTAFCAFRADGTWALGKNTKKNKNKNPSSVSLSEIAGVNMEAEVAVVILNGNGNGG